MLESISLAKSLRKDLRRTAKQRQDERDLRKQILASKLKRGLSGQKLGKHKVPEGNVEVQLGEDLSESLRALKVRPVLTMHYLALMNVSVQPEGNMFRDRFISLQQRGRLEPRALVLYVHLFRQDSLRLTCTLSPTDPRKGEEPKSIMRSTRGRISNGSNSTWAATRVHVYVVYIDMATCFLWNKH